MKKFKCSECEKDGCTLITGDEATIPIACPFGFTRDETKWQVKQLRKRAETQK